MRFIKKLLLVSVFLCVMAAGVTGALYLEHETNIIEDFQYAVGIKEKSKPRGISFSGNKIGQQRRQAQRDQSFLATIGFIFGNRSSMADAHRAAIEANLKQTNLSAAEFEAPQAPPEEVKKTYRSGGLSNAVSGN